MQKLIERGQQYLFVFVYSLLCIFGCATTLAIAPDTAATNDRPANMPRGILSTNNGRITSIPDSTPASSTNRILVALLATYFQLSIKFILTGLLHRSNTLEVVLDTLGDPGLFTDLCLLIFLRDPPTLGYLPPALCEELHGR